MASSSSSPPSKLLHKQGIPPSDRKIVQSLKEIVKTHSDEEIYAALRECNMDPGDTIHKLMHQDTFHEVKRKRDKKRENDSAEVKASVSVSHTWNRASHIPRNRMSDDTVNERARESASYQVSKSVDANRGIDSTSHSRGWSKSSTPSTSNSAYCGQASRNGRTFPASQAYRKSWTRVSGHGMAVDSKLNGTAGAASADTNISESVKVTSNFSEVSGSNQLVADSEKDRCDQDPECSHWDEIPTGATPSVNSNSLTIHTHPDGKPSIGSGSGRPHAVHHHEERLSGVKPPSYNHRNRVSHPSQQQVLAIKRAPPVLEWKPKPSVQKQTCSEVLPEIASAKEAEKPLPTIPEHMDNEAPAKCLNPENLKSEDQQSVFIPEHLQVPEADSAGLSFGTFDMGFEKDFSGKLCLDDIKPIDSTVSSTKLLSEHLKKPNVMEEPHNMKPVTQIETSPSSTAEIFVTCDNAVVSMVTEPEPVSTSEISNPEPLIRQGRQLTYIQALPSYQGFRLVPQESQPQEASRLPNFVQPFTDPASNYFSPVFCSGSDVDMLYQFPLSSNSSKNSSSVTMMSGQTLHSSQEVSQIASVSHATLAVVQPSLPIHAYAAQPTGVTISPYGANVYSYHQFMPANYAYVHAPYQSSYPQPSIGISYASNARGYPPVAAAMPKYPAPQYKHYKVGINNTPHPLAATGYGGFATVPSGFAPINSAANAGSVSNYDEQQYKDYSVYASNHQMEGSTVWVQAPLSRDVPGIQTNSFYNLHNQGQPSGYLHSQLTQAHHPGASFGYYASSGATPTNHQQPHALGSAGVVSHSVIFQPQPGQVNWTNNYSARN